MAKNKIFSVIPAITLVLLMTACGGTSLLGNIPPENNGNNGNNNGNNGGAQQPGTQQPSGTGYRVAYSNDGINWTISSDRTFNSGGYFPLCDIVYGNGTFLLQYKVNSEYKLAYSSDGINWNLSEYQFDDWRNITFAKDKFFAATVDSNVATYSENGINWTNVTITAFGGGVWPNNGFVRAVAYGDGKYIAVGNKEGNSFKNYAYSTDGVTWTLGTGDFTSSAAKLFIIWGNDVWVASNGWTSTDYSVNGGTTWRPAYIMDQYNYPSYAFGGDIDDIAFGNGKFVMVGSRQSTSSGVIVCSEDGVNWTVSESGFGSYVSCTAFGNGKWTAGVHYEYGGDKVIYSPDGINWTVPSNTIFGNSGEIHDIAFGNGKFVAVGYVK